MAQGKKTNDMTNGNSKYQQTSTPPQRKEGSMNGSKLETRQSGNVGTFRTDSAISGGRHQGERTLQRWVPDTPDEFDGSLETPSNRTSGTWDQFAENKRLFGLTTDYNENIYTTAINRNHPQYKQRVAEADRKAREIERSTTNNPHVAEERILNNINGANSKMDEEDKYSGVQRHQNLPSSGSNKYLPPARRGPAGQSSSGSIPISHSTTSQTNRNEKASSEIDGSVKNSSDGIKLKKLDNLVPPTNSNRNSISESKQGIAPTPPNRKASSQAKSEAKPNATATVERDVASAFKNFASQQRKNVDQIRLTRAKNDKEVKLNDLKAFANSFKLHTPVPSDLVPIIAKDPKKQKEIQAKAQRNAEEAEASKLHSQESSKACSSLSDARINRPISLSRGSNSSSNVPNRQNNGRNINFTQQSYRVSQQVPNLQQNRGSLGNRLKGLDQTKSTNLSQNHTTLIDSRPPPTGPANNIDINLSRLSGIPSLHGARLNPNSIEFRPSPYATSFNPSVVSSPQSVITTVVPVPRARSILRRKPLPPDERPSIVGKFDTLEFIKSLAPPSGKELAWKATGGLMPAYDTPPVWKQAIAEDKADCPIRLTYSQVFEPVSYTTSLFSPSQSHVLPHIPPHQQQSIHLSHLAHGMVGRQSPHQVPISLYGNHQTSNTPFSGAHDDHRMLPSHSAQSFASPRLQNVPMAYPSPINQATQLSFNSQMMQITNGPQLQVGYRSLSNTHQFIPPQNHMGQMMMPNPAGTFVTPQGITPGPQMIYQGNQPPPYIPTNNIHTPMISNVNGYPSPGRASTMMVNQGSQQGPQQPAYGINPGVSSAPNYGNPMFSQQPSSQVPVRPFVPPNNQPHGSNHQSLHHFGPQNRRSNQNNGNFHPGKSFQHNQPQTTNITNQMPVVSQLRRIESSDEAK
ncbi:hypothetical protein EPUL_003493 [Erysiphe pulchra]|uniref:LsmAD domain-containing protein n=1 Tax=Erysiphe pulchra TaxID=225359 RepID=A0A2S4PQZ0_9PEZI|nr:hypothetical protein EPUL_003493 [Erysiphe pulchra]